MSEQHKLKIKQGIIVQGKYFKYYNIIIVYSNIALVHYETAMQTTDINTNT